ncbi:MAG: ATP synthase F1 subunit delta [Armatimonadota bacterium]
MRLTSLARRYAGALFETAREADIIDKVESDLGLMTYTMQSMPSLAETVNHPLIPADRKKNIVREVFGSNVQSITLDFLCLLIDRRREEILEDAEYEYIQIANNYRGVVEANVTSAVALTEDEQTRLRAKLEGLTGKKIELQIQEDKDLIGGLVVKIGDTVIDGSVKGYLAALKDRLLGRE